MGTRALEAQLTSRILALAAVVLIAVGVTTVVVCDHVLAANDTTAARSDAVNSRDAFLRELAEGDPPADAAAEVLADAAAGGIRVTLVDASGATYGANRDLPELRARECTSFADDRGRHWRACATEEGSAMATAAVSTEAHRDAIRSLAVAMVGIVFLAGLAFWIAVRRAVRTPLTELDALVDWTTRIVETVEVEPPPVTTTTEIAHLETAFDALLRRILDALSRERATSAHIAHELRTPLTSLRAEIDALKPSDEASRSAWLRAKSDLARLADVIDAILLLSANPRATGGLVLNVADLARSLAPAGTVVVAPDEALLEGDERLIALAIRNLMENASKYAGGARTLTVSREGDSIRVAVGDEGPGIEECSRSKMFGRYWRGSADGAGRGLGLALVRAVAERHGGFAEARAAGEGTGLVVSFSLGPCVGWQIHPAPR